MNINNEIWEYAKSAGLDWIATGGGCDYVFKAFPSGAQAIIASQICGESPETINEACDVVFYSSDEWLAENYVLRSCRTVREAVDLLADLTDFGLSFNSKKWGKL